MTNYGCNSRSVKLVGLFSGFDSASMPDERERELADHIRETAEAIAELHTAHRAGSSRVELWLEHVVLFFSQPLFLCLLTVCVVVWIAGNVAASLFGASSIDPAPYPLLQGLLTLLGVYVSLAILAGQRRVAALSELRSQINLEHTILAEHKAAKMIELLEEFRQDHPALVDRHDPQASELAVPTDPKDVAAAIVESQTETRAERNEPT